MAINVFLGSNGDNFTVANNNVNVKGFAGTQNVTISSGVTGTTTNADVERIDVAGNLSTYTFKYDAAAGGFVAMSGTTVVLTVPSVNGTTNVVFADGSAALVQTATGFTLGGQTVAVGTTAAAITSTAMGTSFNTAVTSGSGTNPTPSTGLPFTLTTSAETKSLSAGNDTVNGELVDSIVGDTIVDTSTTDNDTLTATISTSPSTAFVVTNVENITIDDRFGNSTVSAANISGGNLTMKSSAGNTTTVNNIGTAAANLTITAGDNISTLTLNQTAATTDSAVTLNLAGKTLAGLTNTVDLLTINATGAASSIVGAGAGLFSDDAGDKVTVTGSANLTITDTTTNLTGETVVKSGYTGVLEVRSSDTAAADYSKIAADNIRFTAAAAGDISVTVANNQKVTIFGDIAATQDVTFTTENSGGTLNLVLDTTAAVGSTAGTDAIKTTNFSTVNVTVGSTSSTTSASLDLFTGESTTTVNVDGGAKAVTFIGVTTAKEIIANSAMTGSLTVAVDSTGVDKVTGAAGGDVLQLVADRNFTFDGGAGSADIIDILTTTTNDLSDNTVSFTNVEYIRATTAASDAVLTFASAQLEGKTLGIVGLDNAGTADVVNINLGTATAFNGANISTNNIVGTTHVDININGTAVNDTIKGTSSADSIDGAAGTDSIEGNAGNDTIVGGDGKDTILGGAGDDSITGGAGADSMTGGDGADIYVFASLDGSAVGSSGGTFTGFDIITDFKAGAGAYDTMGIGAAGTSEVAITTTKATAVDNAVYFVASNPVIGGTAITALTQDSFTDVDKVANFLNTIATSTGSATDVFTFVVNDTTGNKAAIYHVIEGGTAVFAAAEIQLVGIATLTNGAISATDFIV